MRLRASPAYLNKLVKRLIKEAGVRQIHPHLFRHTRATTAAQAGWNEPQMQPNFGWSASSREPKNYVHLAAHNVEARVRADAGIDELGKRGPREVAAAPSGLVEMMAAAVAAAVPAAVAETLKRLEAGASLRSHSNTAPGVRASADD